MREMDSLSKASIDCQCCRGFCCTKLYNSMQVTPLEALEVTFFLTTCSEINLDELIDNIEKIIKDYRLDYEVSCGKGGIFRRYYTCPFYKEGAEGCLISFDYKPYGCLSFNPQEKKVSVEGKCYSNIALLKRYEKKFGEYENIVNDQIKKDLGIYWNKISLPVAVKFLLSVF